MARPEAWHAVSAAEALGALGTDLEGLSDTEAVRRLAAHGANRLPEQRGAGPLERFSAQFRNPLIYTLLAAATISAGIGHGTDAMVIAAVVLVNAMIGFVQEGRAERALAAIRDLVQPRASVRRDGRRQTIPAEAVVPGDILLLEAGDRVQADLRVVEAHGLRVDQAVLTGESVPVDKAVEAVSQTRRSPTGSRWPSPERW
jgi:magnesium-transporting ATPase (P-type)